MPFDSIRRFCMTGLLVFAPLVSHADGTITFTARKQIAADTNQKSWQIVETPTQWDAAKTAVILCDLWDTHPCVNAVHRMEKMLPAINRVVAQLRKQGALVIHSPSNTMQFYEGTVQRKRAQEAAYVQPPFPVDGWCSLDPAHEPPLPVDDSDGGCDDEVYDTDRVKILSQHPEISIAYHDAISDSGQEIYNLMAARGIENVIILGVHTNMCVLGRPFGIRSMVKLGKNVVLVRDLTDSMYNPKMPPYVPHKTGTALVIDHIERYWCPTTLSLDLLK